MKALILVDLQREFLPEGAWELPQAEALISLANQVQRQFRLVAATQDWHPRLHKIFAASHDQREVGEVIEYKKQVFELTRVHCVQKTSGAELAPALQRERIHRVFQRGLDTDLNGYSAFFENDHRTSTGLTEFLRSRKVLELFVMGFSPDGVVAHTALDAQALGFKTTLILDGISAAPLSIAEKAREDRSLQDAQVNCIFSRDLR